MLSLKISQRQKLQSATWKSGPSKPALSLPKGPRQPSRKLGGFSPCGLLLLRGPEIERRRIHAIPQPRRRWTIVKHMPQVRIARRAANLGAYHAVARILVLDHATARGGLGETWPARSGIKLRLRIKQRSPAAHAVIHPRILRVPVRPGEGALGSCLARYVILLGREFLLPLRLRLH